MLSKGQDHCLYVFTYDEFSSLTAALRQAPLTNAKARDYSRMLFASASEEKTDGQGRVTIPPMLREYAGLSKECAVIGADTRVEIWAAHTWERYVEAKEAGFADITEELMPSVH